MKKEIRDAIVSIIKTFNNNMIEHQRKYESDYERHRKFVKDFFNIDLPKDI